LGFPWDLELGIWNFCVASNRTVPPIAFSADAQFTGLIFVDAVNNSEPSEEQKTQGGVESFGK
jgi:hypothetical protein